MKRLLMAMCAATGIAGCYADYYSPSGGVSGSAYFSLPIGPPPPVTVSAAPPPSRYEAQLSCGYGEVFVAGQWDWNGSWYWVPGFCTRAQSGYSYIPPSYNGGVFIRGHWGQGGGYGGGNNYGGGYHGGGGGYVPPPAPAYRPAPPAYGGGGGGGYVPPPAPAYGGGGGGGGGYVPPPAPAYGGGGGYTRPPQTGPSYAPPPAPAPSNRGHAPPPAPGYERRPGDYVPPPAPATR